MLNFVEVQRQLMGMVQEQASRRQDFGQRIGIAEQEAKKVDSRLSPPCPQNRWQQNLVACRFLSNAPAQVFPLPPVPNDGLSLRRTARKFSPTATRR